MTPNWWNNYLAIPYLANGRTRAGLDCWGLVRLVHAEVFDHELPSLAADYDISDRQRVADLIATRREGWELTQAPRSGDVVLLRVDGADSHMGIVTRPGYFLHVREDQDSVIERLDSATWKHRVSGIYRYTDAATPIAVAAIPHPLRTARIDTQMMQGLSLAQMAVVLRESNGVSDQLSPDALIAIDGEYIPREQWAVTVPRAGALVEYRAVVRGSGVGRMIGMLAIAAFAWWAAPALISLGGVNLAATLGSTGLGLLQAGISAGINLVGGLLLNAIFPVRPQSMGDTSGARPMHMLQGGSNTANKYGAIPVVLGRYRYTPPIGAETYVESSSSTSYLRMVLIWGYGPMQISDLRIGSTPIDTYEEVQYETLNGWDDTAEDKARFNSLYGRDVTQETINVKLSEDVSVERTLLAEVDSIKVTFNFPMGLWAVDQTSGKTYERKVWLSIKVRPAGTSSWKEVAQTIPARTLNLSPAWYNVDSDAELEPVYQWTRLSLSKYNQIIVRRGSFTASAYSEPSGTLLARLKNDTHGQITSYDRLPVIGAEEEQLWDICVLGDAVYTTIDRRGNQGYGSVSGVALTIAGLIATLDSGEIMRSQIESLVVQKKIKRAFSTSIDFLVPHGSYDVSVTRTSGTPPSNTTYDDCYLSTITGYSNNKPLNMPAPMAMTAIRIKATDQLNGSVDGITGTAQVIAKDFDRASGTWVLRPTRNPASLMRHVLQHPGNARRCPDSKINLPALEDFHDFCRINKFTFDFVLTGQKSLDDVLRDICAAGRASPTRVDGKHSVIIDRPRNEYAQFFTPHNSWGFEGARALPVIPDAFRVSFANAAKGYQPDELIVYNDGFSASNAKLFEGLALPGVTSDTIVFKQARFHLAQIKLRPETYTLNADIEHLICTRGDLVKVTHDVPMWGLGSGRIKNLLSSTSIEVDEDWPMDAGVQYTIRIRLENGTSTTRTVAPVAVDGYYSTLTLTSALNAAQGAPGNLVMFGRLNAESVDLIVQAIEPAENITARLTLVDYSPAIYDSDLEAIPPFDSQITRPPTLVLPTVTQTPTIVSVVSDERAMTRLSPGNYQYGIRVGFSSPKTLPQMVTHLEGQIEWAEDSTTDWTSAPLIVVGAGVITFHDVTEGDTYKFRLRYVDSAGRTGPWTAVQTHTVVGKATKPSVVTGLRYWFSDTALTTATITLDWNDSPEVDVEKFEVSNGSRTVVLNASTFTEQAAWIGARTYSVVAIDAAGNRSDAATITVTKYAPGMPVHFRANIIDNNVLLYWESPAVTSLPLSTFELRRGADWSSAEVIGRKSGGFTSLFETSAGTRTYWLAAIDTDNNYGEPASLSVSVNEPPDFVLHASFNSALTGTLSSALLDSGTVLMPVDTAATVASHFTANGWASPADQIAAGYPLFLQPSAASGYYEETFDVGLVLLSSRISVNYSGQTVAGVVATACGISVSPDGTTWTALAGGTDAYATNFRYVKVRITSTPTNGTGLYRLTSVAVRSSIKLKNESATVACVSSATNGTIFNFAKEYLDVTSIQVTAQGTTPVTAVWDFQDAIISGTYTVASNVATVNATAHGLAVGQKVRLNFTSGSAPAGIYTVATVPTANQFTVALTTANTSGNASLYPAGLRIYLFNNAGTRVSGNASVTIEGY